MWLSFLSLLAGLSRKAAWIGTAIMGLGVVVLRIVAYGRRKEREAQAAKAAEAASQSKGIEDETDRMSDADLNGANARWVRKP